MYICEVFKKYILMGKNKIDYEIEIIPRNISRVCRNDASSFLYKQSPDFPKPGLCHVQKNLHL